MTLAHLFHSKKPWIIVWDLDETLVTGWKHDWKPIDIIINPNTASIMSIALKLRITGAVKYIFLLTNNSDEEYINASVKKIGEYINYKDIIFNDILINNPMVRTCKISKSIYNPDKSLKDVDFLLKNVKDVNNNTAYRILFFDDRNDHVFKWQLPSEHYINITPPFIVGNGLNDSTPWNRVLNLLNNKTFTRKRRPFNLRRITRKISRQNII